VQQARAVELLVEYTDCGDQQGWITIDAPLPHLEDGACTYYGVTIRVGMCVGTQYPGRPARVNYFEEPTPVDLALSGHHRLVACASHDGHREGDTTSPSISPLTILIMLEKQVPGPHQ